MSFSMGKLRECLFPTSDSLAPSEHPLRLHNFFNINAKEGKLLLFTFTHHFKDIVID